MACCQRPRSGTAPCATRGPPPCRWHPGSRCRHADGAVHRPPCATRCGQTPLRQHGHRHTLPATRLSGIGPPPNHLVRAGLVRLDPGPRLRVEHPRRAVHALGRVDASRHIELHRNTLALVDLDLVHRLLLAFSATRVCLGRAPRSRLHVAVVKVQRAVLGNLILCFVELWLKGHLRTSTSAFRPPFYDTLTGGLRVAA